MKTQQKRKIMDLGFLKINLINRLICLFGVVVLVSLLLLLFQMPHSTKQFWIYHMHEFRCIMWNHH